MAVSIRNVQKFFVDHLEYAAQRERVMSEFAENLGDQKVISGGLVRDVLGNTIADEFFQEVTSDGNHIQMGLEDLQQVE